MLITNIEELSKNIIRVYIDHEYEFPLHPREINKYSLQAGNEISVETFKELLDIVLERAKQKAVDLLLHMDRTEAQLRDKLKKASYPENIIEQAIIYVKNYGYINDIRYASIYTNSNKEIKSKRAIEYKLISKGVNKEIIDAIFSNEYISEEDDASPEEIAVKKAINKKVNDITILSFEEKQKLIASLYRKGFDINIINKVLNI